VVTRAPGPEQVKQIEAQFPGTTINLQVNEGMQLSELSEQDSYSFALAHIFMGAGSQKRLLRNYKKVRKSLGFETRAIDTEGPKTSFVRAS